MAKTRRSPAIKKLSVKQQRGRTKNVTQPRPSQTSTTKIRPQQWVEFKKGFGQPLEPEDIAERSRRFKLQQAKLKTPVRSIVGRAPQRGERTTMRIAYKRGAKVAAERLKQFAEFGELEVIKELKVTSSWVSMIHLVKFRNEPALAITFRDGFVALYPTSNIRDYEAMSRSASKGKYVWAALYHGRKGQGAPYISIRF